MDGYKSLGAWQSASVLCLSTLEAIDRSWTWQAKPVFDQLARAVVSVDVNIVEGYALGTTRLYRRHLRIAYGSAAEAERLIQIAVERGYLDTETAGGLLNVANTTLRALFGLLRSKNLRPAGSA